MERDRSELFREYRGAISIHALRMERDSASFPHFAILAISIHALRMERDWLLLFLSFP